MASSTDLPNVSVAVGSTSAESLGIILTGRVREDDELVVAGVSARIASAALVSGDRWAIQLKDQWPGPAAGGARAYIRSKPDAARFTEEVTAFIALLGEMGVWLPTKGVPAANVGKDGDLAFDAEAYKFFRKVEGAWKSIVSAEVADAAKRLDALQATQTTDRIIRATWSDLAAMSGFAGQGAEVLETDTGSHTDPVAGGTVPNAGVYTRSTSPAGWKRIGSSAIGDLQARTANAVVDAADQTRTQAHQGANGRLAYQVLPDGTFDVGRLRSLFTALLARVTAKTIIFSRDLASADGMMEWREGIAGFGIEDKAGRQAMRLTGRSVEFPGTHPEIRRLSGGRMASNGTHRVFCRRRGAGSKHDIFAERLDTATVVALTSDPADVYDFTDPVIEGVFCTFIRRGGAWTQRWSVPLDGSAPAVLAEHGAILLIGDSFATPQLAAAIETASPKPIRLMRDGVGGSTLVEQAARFLAASFEQAVELIIMDGGPTDASPEAAVAAIGAMIAAIKTNPKRVTIIEPGMNSTAVYGSAERIARDAIWNAIKAAFPLLCVETLPAMLAAGNGSADDLADIANGVWPRSLRADGIHPIASATAGPNPIMASLLMAHRSARGFHL